MQKPPLSRAGNIRQLIYKNIHVNTIRTKKEEIRRDAAHTHRDAENICQDAALNCRDAISTFPGAFVEDGALDLYNEHSA